MNEPARRPEATISVILVDDSKIQHGLMRRMFQQIEGLELVGGAHSAEKAMEVIEQFKPDVVLLDINLPGMSGLDFLERKGAHTLPPCIVLSAFVSSSEGMRKRAKKAGAADVISKPVHGSPEEIKEVFDNIQRAIFEAHHRRTGAPLRELRGSGANVPTFRNEGTGDAPDAAGSTSAIRAISIDVPIIVGSSTGGPSALATMLKAFPARHPPVVIAQHMPSTFTLSLARSLASETKLDVVEARTGDEIRPNRVYVGPGDRHLRLRKVKNVPTITTITDLPNQRYRPSIDVLMTSAMELFRARAIGVILTGMGRDGAEGLLAMRRAGCHTVVQDEASSTVFGMPRAAIKAGAAEAVVDVDELGPTILKWLQAGIRR